ncbi:MAG: putative GTP cyclohydrolase 1 type 2 NIF3 family [Candidatus Methanohalarchaeum thermophilum]|uniref:GTP cyclohydrolase 1 type 2 NIF3 family n=1 Tax=Methanohalarchaeum thermophilum TaxID=1903181 RepID=A0A1Q6DWJ1_METT1|nr:MAG: putative GTP cyclohydrolase 1 type 2 NIF3 family [Candidatus Methanohalarchaeum thermophilum]
MVFFVVKLKKLHEFAIEEGKKEDPRGSDQISKLLDKREDEYEDLEGVKKEKYDEDKLNNPFDDSKLIFGADREVEKLAVGIDIETQDLLLLDRLREKGEDIDGAIAHHPVGRALANLHEVLKLQVDTLVNVDVPVSQAESFVKKRSKDVMNGTHGGNHPRAPKTAELLNIPLMSLHTAADNHAHQFIKDYLEEKDPYKISDLMDVLLEIPEYKWALEYDMGPTIFNGDEDNRVGKLAYDYTGGTELGKERLEKMAQSGVNTIVAMHMSKDQIEEAQEQNINVVASGHMSSDSIGLNILLDKAKKEFGIDIVEFSGFKRVSRL